MMTKTIVTALVMYLVVSSTEVAWAQYPRVISYTGVLADSLGRPLKGPCSAEFTLVNSNGDPHPSGWKHTETFLLNGGMFTARLGDVSQGSSGPFPMLEGDYSLSILVATGDGSKPLRLPGISLSASPYSLYALEIADSAVSETKIQSASVTTAKVRDRSITEPKMADASVSTRAVQSTAITSDKIQNGAVIESKLAPGSVGESALMNGSVTESKLAPGSVGESALMNGSVTESKLAPGSVGESSLKAGSVTSIKIAPGSIDSLRLQDKSIFSNHLSDGAVTELALANNTVANRHLQWYCVNSYNIRPDAVGNRELQNSIDITRLTMAMNPDDAGKIHAYFGDLYAASGSNQGQYQGYGLAIFGKDGVDPNWNTGQSVCGFRTDGAVYGTSKPFIVPDPTDNSRKIQYTAIEGPEAAMYCRGTAKLVNGKATIALPPHFKAMAVDTGITVHLTPASASSLGLAITSVSNTEFTVQELQNGNGSYSFTFWAAAVRKGYEKYKVYLYPDDIESAAQPSRHDPATLQRR